MCRDECFLQSKAETMIYVKMLLHLCWKDGYANFVFKLTAIDFPFIGKLMFMGLHLRL